jgi:hypothetical protein
VGDGLGQLLPVELALGGEGHAVAVDDGCAALGLDVGGELGCSPGCCGFEALAVSEGCEGTLRVDIPTSPARAWGTGRRRGGGLDLNRRLTQKMKSEKILRLEHLTI